MERKLFSAKDVHQVFHWLSAATVFNRIKNGLLPTEKRLTGTREKYVFSFAGLVHIGVVEQLYAVGLWQDRDSLIEEPIYIPAPTYQNEWNRVKPQPLSKKKTKMRAPLAFYEIHHFCVRVLVDVVYWPEPRKMGRRLKRSERIYQVSYCPDPQVFPDARALVQPGCEVFRVEFIDGRPTDCFTTATINVRQIASEVRRKLGLVVEGPGS